jgi:hypothetical protein
MTESDDTHDIDADKARRQRSVDPLPGVSGNMMAPFQRGFDPLEGPSKSWPFLITIGAVVAAVVIGIAILH